MKKAPVPYILLLALVCAACACTSQTNLQTAALTFPDWQAIGQQQAGLLTASLDRQRAFLQIKHSSVPRIKISFEAAPPQEANTAMMTTYSDVTQSAEIRVYRHALVSGKFDIERVLDHEVNHALVYRLGGTNWPAWFTEGLAILGADQLGTRWHALRAWELWSWRGRDFAQGLGAASQLCNGMTDPPAFADYLHAALRTLVLLELQPDLLSDLFADESLAENLFVEDLTVSLDVLAEQRLQAWQRPELDSRLLLMARDLESTRAGDAEAEARLATALSNLAERIEIAQLLPRSYAHQLASFYGIQLAAIRQEHAVAFDLGQRAVAPKGELRETTFVLSALLTCGRAALKLSAKERGRRRTQIAETRTRLRFGFPSEPEAQELARSLGSLLEQD